MNAEGTDTRAVGADLFGRSFEDMAIERLQTYEPADGYYVAFAGGKDSVVLLDLVKRSGVRYDAHYAVTTVDPPELMRFIKKHHPEVAWERPEMGQCLLFGDGTTEREGEPDG